MKTNNTLLIVIGVLILGGIGFFALRSNFAGTSETTTSDSLPTVAVGTQDEMTDESMQEDKMMEDENGDAMSEGGRYVAYSQGSLEATQGTRRVLYFYANWCPTCKPADASFRTKTDQIPSNVTIIRVNYNDSDTDPAEEALADEYGVTYQHTFVQIDENGNEVAKWNGGEIEELLERII
jgi:thiol-disulfide isomerase/thioredoxin